MRHIVWRSSAWAVAAVVAIQIGLTGLSMAHDEPNGRPHHKGNPANPTAVMKAFLNSSQSAQTLPVVRNVPCIAGDAAGYPCENIDLLSFLPLDTIGGDHLGSAANDIWGWTDPDTGREYALVGRIFGTSVVDITNPINAIYLGEVFTHNSVGSNWRDIKVFQDHAFIVSEASNHGMQVFDLTGLRTADPMNAPYDFMTATRYTGFGSAHNLVINEDTGFAYGVGTNTCSGGLHMVDINNPTNPTLAGCFSTDGYTHDAQCVIYAGPDTDHLGKEICFAANEDTVTIVDVTTKGAPDQLSRTGYDHSGYAHQGWLSEDHSLYFLDDELDERNDGHNTRTRIFDVSDLDAPSLIGFFDNATPAIDHNLYVKGDRIYQANYRAGLSILDSSDAANGNLTELGYFDVYPANDFASFNGAWSNYPYLDSGVVVISGIEQGLFVVLPAGVDFISLAAPADGADLEGVVPIEIKAQHATADSGTLTVAWQIDGGPWEPTTYNPATDIFESNWDTGVETAGSHTVTARMTDTNNNQWFSRAITVTAGVSGTDDPPTVAIQSPEPGPVSGNVTLTAVAGDDGAVNGVEFFIDGVKHGDADFNGSVWTKRWNTKKAGDGDHEIMAVATDDGGQTGDDSITVTVGGGDGGDGGDGGGGGKPECHPKRGCPSP